MPDIEHLRLEDHAKVWFVTNPTEHSELGDIYYQADLRNIQLQAIGIKETLPGLTLYMSGDDARRDAELRLKERDGEGVKMESVYIVRCRVCKTAALSGSTRKETVKRVRAAGWMFNEQGEALCTDCPQD